MEKKVINSFGSIVIPAHIRKELGIDGNMMLWVDVRETKNGDKEIVLRRYNSSEEILKKYKTWAEVISRISECSVSIVWNNTVLSMSSNSMTEDFTGRSIAVNPFLSAAFKRVGDNVRGVIVPQMQKLNFLPNGDGDVAAYFKINNTGDDSCFFVIVKGTKYDGKRISRAEEERRFQIIGDIVEKL